ncbi:MAG: YARHG domain-containing protein [Candidatus Kapabacteria bacterium]|jgi:hypothetical protein|nr:YARHG domain-containing protein [Candidatus Kapabacteria bacterium]
MVNFFIPQTQVFMRFFKVFIACFLFSTVAVFANDGAYYASGNHLIPMMETDIRVQKEILTIQCVGTDMVKVTVYYEFFNPKAAKTLEVGFEAQSPSGDVDGTPVKGQHPYISDFTVNFNGQALAHSVALVNQAKYFQKGKILAIPLKDALKSIENTNEVPFNYVYHFKADFTPGVNTLTHTYLFKISGSVDFVYNFNYILTAAMRWGNKRIDDFTLSIDMGEFMDFYISQTFFKGAEAWEIEGSGRKAVVNAKAKGVHEAAKNSVHFWLREGKLTFRAKNFTTKDELYLFSLRDLAREEVFSSESMLPLAIGDIEETMTKAKNEVSLKILRNLPFARRGAVFKTREIQQYYEKMPWYIPNSAYKPDVPTLKPIEQEWLKKVSMEKK